MNAQSEASSPAAAGDPKSEGRPRTLNAAKRSEVIELISDGLGLEQAARHVRCSARTIRREMKRDPDFGSEVRRSEKFAQLNPLQALQRAVHHNWRAAAWLLERMFPERFARRPQPSAFGAKQARQLLNEVLQIVEEEEQDTRRRDRIDGRIRAAFEYRIHVYCGRKRSTAGLRRATEWFEKKDQRRDPLADFGLLTPDLDDMIEGVRELITPSAPGSAGGRTDAKTSLSPKPPAEPGAAARIPGRHPINNSLHKAATTAQPPMPEAESSKHRAAAPERPVTMTETQGFLDHLNADPRSPVSPMMKAVQKPKQEKSQCVTPNASPVDKTIGAVSPPASRNAVFS